MITDKYWSGLECVDLIINFDMPTRIIVYAQRIQSKTNNLKVINLVREKDAQLVKNIGEIIDVEFSELSHAISKIAKK